MSQFKQPALEDDFGVLFNGRAETVTGNTWWYTHASGKRVPLRPRLPMAAGIPTGRWVSDKEYWEDGKPDPTVVVLPRELSNEIVDAALRATAVFHDIKGSALTVNREKMRIRYRALIAAVESRRASSGGQPGNG